MEAGGQGLEERAGISPLRLALLAEALPAAPAGVRGQGCGGSPHQ